MAERFEESEEFRPIRRQHLEGHAVAVGYVCFAWSHLEISIDSLLMHLIGIYQQDDAAAELVTSHMTLQKKLEIIKGVGFLKKLSDEWLDKLFAVVAKIQELGKQRNHYVHDFYWPMGDDDGRVVIVRQESRVRLRKIKGEHVVRADEVEILPTEIWDLVHAIHEVSETLGELHSVYYDANPPPP